jgi:hypothetical protein
MMQEFAGLLLAFASGYWTAEFVLWLAQRMDQASRKRGRDATAKGQ